MKNKLTTKHPQTGRVEHIVQQDLESLGWGFHFFVDNELEAYKAAYLYKDAPHGVKVEFAMGSKRWMITVFNEAAAEAGINV